MAETTEGFGSLTEGFGTLFESIPLIDLRGVSKSFPMGEERIWVLRHINLKIERGDFVAIVGPSGSGKTTLMNIMGCLTHPDKGEYVFNAQNVTKLSDEELAVLRNKSLGFVFQQFHLLARHDALNNIVLPTHYRAVTKDDDPNFFFDRARALLGQFGLSDRANYLPNELSGGQKQRVAISRALLLMPELILADEPTGALDSQSAAEILAELEKLHKSGHTIVMVTHDATVAARAHRILKMQDGRIVLDKRLVPLEQQFAVTDAPTAVSMTDAVTYQSQDIPEARFVQAIRRAWTIYFAAGITNLSRNRMRSTLTMLGVIIGVGAVIAMITIGDFVRDRVLHTVNSRGTNTLFIDYARQGRGDRGRTESESGRRYDYFRGFDYERDIVNLHLDLPEIATASPDIVVSDTIVSRMNSARNSTRVKGVGAEFIATVGHRIASGRNFSNSDIRDAAGVAVIGQTVAEKLFRGDDPIGKEIRVRVKDREGQNVRLEVIGILRRIDASENRDPNDVVFTPFTVAQIKLLSHGRSRYLDNFVMATTDFRLVKPLMKKMNDLLHARYGDQVKFNIFAKEAALADTRKFLTLFQSLLGGIAVLSLLVGGIGIMNMMLVTVTERTREIGLRKALGAREIHIERLFLAESIVLCVSGGLIGVGLGFLIANSLVAALALIYKNIHYTFVYDNSAVALAFLFSVAVGIIFGVVPARRAARLDPVESLRWE